MRPLIGIPISARDAATDPGESALDARIGRALAAAGGSPVLVPRRGDAASALAGVDGLLIPGGPDFAPEAPYPAHVHFDPAPAEEIAFDVGLVSAAEAAGLPVFGICYGMQLLAVRAGGRLHYDLATDLPSAAQHELPEPDGRHRVLPDAGTRLAEILGTELQPVNSRHHQAVAAPGRALRVCALSEDGVVEAVEGVGVRFHLGVQWHPERMPAAHCGALFDAFVGACDARRRPSSGGDAV